MKKKIVYVSSCVILDFDFRILLSKRPENTNFSGFWEFPGGKIETNETPQQCLERELQEELGVSSTAGDVIGEDDVAAAYITRLTTDTNGYVYKAEMACIETPTTGDTDINLIANTNSVAEDAD